MPKHEPKGKAIGSEETPKVTSRFTLPAPKRVLIPLTDAQVEAIAAANASVSQAQEAANRAQALLNSLLLGIMGVENIREGRVLRITDEPIRRLEVEVLKNGTGV